MLRSRGNSHCVPARWSRHRIRQRIAFHGPFGRDLTASGPKNGSVRFNYLLLQLLTAYLSENGDATVQASLRQQIEQQI